MQDTLNIKEIFKNVQVTISNSELHIGLLETADFPPFGNGLKNYLKNEGVNVYDILYEDREKALENGEIDFLMISSRDLSYFDIDTAIVPSFSVSIEGPLYYPKFFFRPDLRTIKSMKYRCSEDVLLDLAKVIVREKYTSDPKMSKIEDFDPSGSLRTADMAFFSSFSGYEDFLDFENGIDLGMEWEDLTYLPFVYSFFIGIKDALSSEKKAKFALLLNGVNEQKIKSSIKKSSEYQDYSDKRSHLLDVDFRFSQKSADSLQMFYNYLFYFGYINEMPEIELCI